MAQHNSALKLAYYLPHISLHFALSKGIAALSERLLPFAIIKATVDITLMKNKPAQILRKVLLLQHELQH